MDGRKPFQKRTLAERLNAATLADPVTGCLVWQWSTCALGYGRMAVGRIRKQSHRVAYELARGPIPEGRVLDHLCRNKACCNPDHLEAVTQKVNVLRGESFAARNAQKTHCLRGHPLSGDNLDRDALGGRLCRTCIRDRRRGYRERERARA